MNPRGFSAVLVVVTSMLGGAHAANAATFNANPGTLGTIADSPGTMDCSVPGPLADVTFAVSGVTGPSPTSRCP